MNEKGDSDGKDVLTSKRIDRTEDLYYTGNNRDENTGWPCEVQGVTRPKLIEAMAQIMRDGGRVCLIGMDLNGLKAINDSYGHDAGDEAIGEFAKEKRRLVLETAGADELYCYKNHAGGDEFQMMAINRVGGDEGFADRVAEILRREVMIKGEKVTLTVSGGVGVSERVFVGGESGEDAGQIFQEMNVEAEALMLDEKREKNKQVFARTTEALREVPLERRKTVLAKILAEDRQFTDEQIVALMDIAYESK
ncbi:diguanylate cyclase [Patescibacteria group bacterium]|nr:diguanylate cyclase [Patescibacteria group bacterium]